MENLDAVNRLLFRDIAHLSGLIYATWAAGFCCISVLIYHVWKLRKQVTLLEGWVQVHQSQANQGASEES